MTETVESAVAEALRAAYRGGSIDPIAARLPVGDLAAAYRVQEINTRIWARARGGLVGRKIGLTAPAVQKQFGVDQPDYGILFADMQLPCGGHIEAGRLLQPRVEAEVAICLKADLIDPQLTPRDVEAAVDWVSPALEIVDSRIRDWRIGILDTVADNASSGMFVLGKRRVPSATADVVNCAMKLRANGGMISEGKGAASLGGPYTAAAWLARKMIECGLPLSAGDVVLTGALGPMIPMERGSVYEAEIEGLGTVSASY